MTPKKRTIAAPPIYFHTPAATDAHVTLENYARGTLAILPIDNCVFPFEVRRTSDEAPIAILTEATTLLAFKNGEGQNNWTIFAHLTPAPPPE